MLVGDGVVGDDIGGGALGEVLVGGVAGIEAVGAVGIEGEAGDGCIEAVGEGGAVIDIAVVGGDGACDGGVLVPRICIGHRERGVVGAGQGDGEGCGRGCAMLVGDGVVGDDVGGGALGEVLVGGVAGIEAVAAVGIEGEAGDGCIEAVGEGGAVIDIAVVGGDGACDGGVLVPRICIGHRERGVVGAGQGDGEGCGRGCAMLVGDGVVGDDVGGGALGEVLVGGVAGIEAVAAVGIEGEAGDGCIEAVGEGGAVIDIAVVGGDGACDGGVLVPRICIGQGERGVVGAGQGDGEGCGRGCAMLVGDGVVGDDVGGGALGEVLVGGVAGIEAVAAVGIEGEAGDGCIEAVGEGGAVIDIAVVGGDGACDGGVLVPRICIGHRERGVVGAGQGDGEGCGRGCAMLVGDGVVGDDIGGGALRQVLVGGVAGIEAVAAVGIEGEAGDGCIEAVG